MQVITPPPPKRTKKSPNRHEVIQSIFPIFLGAKKLRLMEGLPITIGFHSHGGTPIAEWFRRENPKIIWMTTGGTHIHVASRRQPPAPHRWAQNNEKHEKTGEIAVIYSVFARWEAETTANTMAFEGQVAKNTVIYSVF